MRRYVDIAASLFVITALFLICTGQAVGQDDKNKVELDPGKAKGELPKEVIAAWEKAGAETGWMGPRWQLGLQFSKDRQGFDLGRTVPAFKFMTNPVKGWPKGLATLPAPEQAFGLETGRATDEDVKDLARLKHLTSLHLSFSKLTEAGLKELAGMNQLTSLYHNAGSPIGGMNRPFTDADLKVLAGMKQLTFLDLNFTKVGDAGLKELAGLKRLTTLKLSYTRVTDAGLKELAGLDQLSTLYLWNANVTGTGLKDLAGLKQLAFLDLHGRQQVTEEGLTELAGLKQLTTLWLNRARVTEAAEAELRKALPKCRINFSASN